MIYKSEAKLYFDVVAGLKGSVLVHFVWLGLLGGLGGWADGVCISLGAPWPPTIVSGWFADTTM